MSQTSRLNKLAAYAPLLIGVYFAVHVVLRLLISPSLGKDEAEQVLLAQELAWGYGSQPPLYTWLVAAVFRVVGDGILGLSLVKNLLLAGAYLLTYATVHLMTEKRVPALLAAASLLFLPQVAWESQRALTHSVLLVFAVALFAFVVVRVLHRHGWADYALLGAAFAAGVLAKYNFPIIAIAMILAALTISDFRRRIVHPRFLLTLAVAVALLWRPMLWVVQNQDATLSRAHKLTGGQADDLLMNYLAGIGGLAVGTVSFLALLAVVYAVAAFRSPAHGVLADAQRRYCLLLWRSIAFAFVMCLAMILLFEVTKVKGRWLTPVLLIAPMALVLQVWPRLTPRRVGWVLSFAGVCALLVLVLLPLRTVAGPSIGRLNPLHAPYRQLAADIRGLGFDKGSVLASFNLLGGNMRLQFPQSVVVTPEYSLLKPLPPGKMLLVWDASGGQAFPAKLRRLFERLTDRKLPAAAPRHVEAPMLYAPDHRFRLGAMVIDDWQRLPKIEK
ncbi:MAG: glycosyltransferase family 39 protein [Alphaproteobacteria bacterium]|nr:glycosyltransferase family 39 protein [Alphaproteobacteria bacterium]